MQNRLRIMPAEIATALLSDETMEVVGNKVEEVTRPFRIFRHGVLPIFIIGWAIFSMVHVNRFVDGPKSRVQGMARLRVLMTGCLIRNRNI